MLRGRATNGRLIFALACASLGVMALTPAAAVATFPGGNGKIAFHTDRDGNYEIYAANPDGSSPTRLTNNPANDVTPNWSPDGTKIVFVSARDGNWEIYTMNADGSGQTRITTNSVDDTQPAWSADGTRLAFTSNRDGNYEIYTMDPNGANVVRLTNNPSNEGFSSWSPDGTKIAFQTDRSGNFDIWTMNADGTSQTNRTNNAAYDEFPDWSPDAATIVFDSNRDGNFELYSMNADGTSQTRRTNAAGSDIAGGLSPQNNLFYWAANRGNFDIYTSQFTVTTTSSDDEYPDWQPIARNYARPRGATPLFVPLVPAYKNCTSPNTSHRGALGGGSCFAPAPESSYLTVGTPDFNGLQANSVGSVRIAVFCNGGASGEQPPCSTTAGDQLDGMINLQITDVRCQGATASCPNGALGDYAGNLWADIGFRVTDRNNGPTGVGPSANGTHFDLSVAFAVPCTTTPSSSTGSTCTSATTIDAVLGGNTAIAEGKRAIWQLNGSGSDVRLLDAGADGVAQTLGDDTLFAVGGLFFP